ncbi:serine protease snake [Drosophila guanche]|uniref:Blast:Serine protease snake n=1 Tax=Drosophila guanche TaxID=7266 RepID=A0A3B0K1E2_DROGU|nr:serine protease snake [Drosophila guanche]SPP88054.1 blast:Serine protease snake [Drosophila guanche]
MILVLLSLLLSLLLPCGLGQHSDIVRSCTRLKQSVFEEKLDYSFLFPGAPIQRRTVDNCRSYTPLIVGGHPANPKEFPHMARLGRRLELGRRIDWFCGGTLISERFVLTAAHCLESEQGEVNVVRLGELDFDTFEDDAAPRDYNVAGYLTHPNYADPQLYHDIGLVKLAEDVIYDLYKHPACLPFDDQRYSSFIAVGWGSTGFAVKPSAKLLKVKLDRYEDWVCQKVLSRQLEEYPHGFDASTQVCVGSDRAQDTCNGDSGGPILMYHQNYPCMYHVMGITSAGVSCGTPGIPGIYTRVYRYLDWITQTIAKY